MRSNSSTVEIYECIRNQILHANTPSMGQNVCAYVISMCHPKAWGDKYVEGFGESWADWLSYLSELADVASQCRRRIYKNTIAG